MNDWTDTLSAVGLAVNGAGKEARDALAACWEATTDDDHARRCVLAHYLADQQTDVADEVAWDERALAAHGHVRDEELAPLGIGSATAFAPSLHLNLGDGYRRLGRTEDARAQLTAARQSEHILPEDGYGELIRQGIVRLEARLNT